MAHKKKTEQKSNYALKTSKGLRACTVVLYDIALETDLIQRYQLHLPIKKEKLLQSASTPINKQLLIKKNVRARNLKTGRFIKTCSKETVTKKKEKNYKKIKSQQNRKDINEDILLNRQYDETTLTQWQQLTRDSNVKSSSSKNTDEISSTSTDTHFNYMQKMTILVNKNNKDVRKVRAEKNIDSDSKRKLHLNKLDVTYDADIKSPMMGSNDTNCLNKKNLTVVDYNSNMEEISSKSITHTQYNNNLHPINFSDEISCKIKREQSEKNQNSKDSIVQTTCNGEKSIRNKTKRSIARRNLPRIIGNHILPEGTKFLKEVKVEKLRINNNLQSNIPKRISLEQDRCNNNDKNTDKTSRINDTAQTTNIILREKECHTSLEINRSLNTSKISTPLNNNVDLKDKNLPIDEPYSKVINCKNLNSVTKVRNNCYVNDTDSEIIMRHENYTLNHQGQLNKFTNNTEVCENNALRSDRECEEKCTKNILKNTSDLMDIDDERCNISTPLISANKEGTIKQTLKRTLKEKDKDCNLDSKKMKLNRNNWLQNNVIFTKSINYQQCNDSPSTVTTDTTIETNISKEHNQKERPDLRNFLKQIRSERDFKLKPTVETENAEVCKKLSAKEESTLNGTLYEKKSNAQEKNTKEYTSVVSDNEEDDCISLFAESFAEFASQCEDQSLCEKDKSYKSLHSDIPYPMTASSFDKYVKQNNKEFNKEYAECIENNIEASKSNKANEISNNQSNQALNIDYTSTTAESKSLQTRNIYPIKEILHNFIKSYCFSTLRFGKSTGYWQHQCQYKHDVENVFRTVNLEDSKTIIDIMQEALKHNFNYFCEEVYIASLKKLTVDQILKTYKMLHESWNVYLRKDFTISARKNIVCNIIKELLNRKISLKIIVDRMMTLILPTRNLNELYNILKCVDKYVKSGEYWNTLRDLILKWRPYVCKQIVDKILYECIKSKDLQNIEDVNNNLINKLDSTLISTMDKYAIKCFKNILDNKTAKDSYSEISTQNFGESLAGTIASPDSPDPSQSMSFTQQESPIRDDISLRETDANQNENHVTQDVNSTKPYEYGFMQPIDASYAQSTYRDHERFWKFYMDLERFEKGLIYEDYDYVIDILKSYTKKRESELFVSKCCLILQKVKRSEYHFKNILKLTVQMDIFSILAKILFDIGLNILANLVDEEAWGFALQLIQSLNIYDLPYNAEYFLLSAEIYLANKKAVKACDLLKYQNIICTSRDKWYVKSTINDEHVRKKIMCILLDSFCNEFLEYAFFLFQFLLKDQSSYYNPIDLSYYVDKLIILSLSKKDTTLITEMGNLILKHSFVLSTITCRALISTIIHTDEVLARQIYNYAEGIGIYSTVKLLPIIHIIINTDLTEEEIYLIFLQLIKNLVMNFGHAIEFAKPQEIKVYFILEIKMNKQFYCAALQSHYNNQAIVNTKTLIKSVLKKRFDPPILLMKSNIKGRIGKLQSKSLINYLKSEHCN